MNAVNLEWRGLAYDRAKFFVKGTEFAAAFVPGTGYRFVIYETRGGRDDAGEPTLVYRLRDAETVTLAEVREGKQPAIVGVFAEPEQAVIAALNYFK